MGSYIVRHGAMRHLGEFEPGPETSYGRGSRVVVRTDRGLEVGEVLCPSTPRALELLAEPTHGQVVRLLTDEDGRQLDQCREAEAKEFDVCLRFIQQRKLQMELVDVEHVFGGERIIFYYLAEKRVDFRELVKDLARTYQTRI